jgi:hypothetical protein
MNRPADSAEIRHNAAGGRQWRSRKFADNAASAAHDARDDMPAGSGRPIARRNRPHDPALSSEHDKFATLSVLAAHARRLRREVFNP